MQPSYEDAGGRARPEAVPAGALPYLEEVRPSGQAGGFLRSAGTDAGGTFFLALRNAVAENEDSLGDGDVLAVSGETDAEPGDLVVWWTGSERSLALARMQADLSLRPVAGFPAPVLDGGRPPMTRGVVVGRLRRQSSSTPRWSVEKLR